MPLSIFLGKYIHYLLTTAVYNYWPKKHQFLEKCCSLSKKYVHITNLFRTVLDPQWTPYCCSQSSAICVDVRIGFWWIILRRSLSSLGLLRWGLPPPDLSWLLTCFLVTPYGIPDSILATRQHATIYLWLWPTLCKATHYARFAGLKCWRLLMISL